MSYCATLCALITYDLAELPDNTTMRWVFRDVGAPLLLKLSDEAFRRRFLTLRYKMVDIIAILGCSFLYVMPFPSLKANTSMLLPRMTNEHWRSTLNILFPDPLAAVISSFVVAKPCQVPNQRAQNCSYQDQSFADITDVAFSIRYSELYCCMLRFIAQFKCACVAAVSELKRRLPKEPMLRLQVDMP